VNGERTAGVFCSVLDNEGIRRIHEASLAILERVGVQVPHEDALSRFADSGAEVDFAARRVRIPHDLVMCLVGKAAVEFTLYGRDLGRAARFGQGTRNYNSIAGEAWWVDAPGEKRRPPTMKDVATAGRFAQALPWINVVGAMADPLGAADGVREPVEMRCVEVLATLLAHTTKPVHIWFHDRASARFLVELMIALRGDAERAAAYPVCYPFLEPISPLRFPFHGVDLLYETARLNLPVPVGPMAQMGLSAPATIAGTMAQENAEILAGVCIAQLISPGAPVCYGGICHAFDMATTQLIFSGPEQAIFGVAMTQMGKHYGLPVYVNVGLTDSKRPDAQAGLEAGVTLAFAAAAGADIFGHMGISGVDQAASLDMLVMQEEVIAYVESALRAFEISDETLALDVIEDAGPGGGFLDATHTVERFRRELWFPRLLDRQFYDAWLDGGARGMEERCAARKEEILASAECDPLPEDVARAFREIVAAARRESAS